MSSATPEEFFTSLTKQDVPIDNAFSEQLYHTIHLLYPKTQADRENERSGKNDSSIQTPGSNSMSSKIDQHSKAATSDSRTEFDFENQFIVENILHIEVIPGIVLEVGLLQEVIVLTTILTEVVLVLVLALALALAVILAPTHIILAVPSLLARW